MRAAASKSANGHLTEIVSRFSKALQGVPQTGGTPFLLAVSGGSDSLALMHLVHCVVGKAMSVAVATVDHGLRPEAKSEADFVGRQCAVLGWAHATLTWQNGGSHDGISQADARLGRYQLLARHAQEIGAAEVLLGHTHDDQMETLRMRLGRLTDVSYASLGSAGMAPRVLFDGVLFHRPLLEFCRQDLRDWLVAQGQEIWIEDPSNQNPKFERVRVRNELVQSDEGPLVAFRPVAQRWREHVEREALAWIKAHLRVGKHHFRILTSELAAAPDAVRRYVLGCAVAALGSAPRRADGGSFVRDVRKLCCDGVGFAYGGVVFDCRRHREVLIYPEVRDASFSPPENVTIDASDLPSSAVRAIAWRDVHSRVGDCSWRTPVEAAIIAHMEHVV